MEFDELLITTGVDALVRLVREKGRIELLGEQLGRIKDEFATRHLYELNTDKLIEIQIKLLSEMRKEKDNLYLTVEHQGLDVVDTSAKREQYSIDN